MPDYTIIAGQTLPVFEGTLKYSTGAVAEPESVVFVMRSLTSEESLTLTGESKVVSKALGTVSFSPSAADTATPGNYMANWEAKIAGKTMSFPTTGFLWVEVERSLTTKGGAQLVGLPEVKDYCNIPANDRTHDTKLVSAIEAVGPVLENLVGPIRVQTWDEWHEGGHATISVRHKPTYGYSAEPVFTLMAASEYRGPIEYALSVVATPTLGSVYSTMTHPEMGMVVRRTAGGGTYEFWRDQNHPQQSIHLTYQSGLKNIPPNVSWAAKETIRSYYENTMMVGRGFQTVADQMEPQMPLVSFLPRHAIEVLAPHRRAPVAA